MGNATPRIGRVAFPRRPFSHATEQRHARVLRRIIPRDLDISKLRESTPALYRQYCGNVPAVPREVSSPFRNEPVPLLACDAIISLYAKAVDRSLIRENLRLSYTERLEKLQRSVWAANQLRGAGLRALKTEK